MNGYNDHVACLLTCETCTEVYIYISTIDDYLRSYTCVPVWEPANQQTSTRQDNINNKIKSWKLREDASLPYGFQNV